MNLVGKIFVLLILVMSVCFASMATMVYSTHQSWRDRVVNREATKDKPLGLIARLENEEAKYIELEAERGKLDDKLAAISAARAQQVAKLEAELVRLERERNEKHVSYIALEETQKTDAVSLQLATTNLARLAKEIDDLKGTIVVSRGGLGEKMAALHLSNERLHQQTGTLNLLKKQNESLTGQVIELREKLANSVPRGPNAAPRGVAGKVLKTVTQKLTTYVEISLGADDGVAVGQQFEIVRGGSYVGKIEILKAEPDRSVGKVIRKIRNVVQGDTITSSDSIAADI